MGGIHRGGIDQGGISVTDFTIALTNSTVLDIRIPNFNLSVGFFKNTYILKFANNFVLRKTYFEP